MISNKGVMFNKPSYSISSDGHTENDDAPQTKIATVAVVAAVATAAVVVAATARTRVKSICLGSTQIYFRVQHVPFGDEIADSEHKR